MEQMQAKQVLEAVLFVCGHPVPFRRVQDVLPDLDGRTLRRLIEELNGEYRSGGHAFLIQEVAGGFQMVTRQDLAEWVRRVLVRPKPETVSAASLETLAIVAYRQPITKAEIEAIRGVDVTASLDSLIERQFVRVAGRKESPGRPFLYATTNEFLRRFGLRSIEALPTMAVPMIPEHPEPSTESGAEPLVQPTEAAPVAAATSDDGRTEELAP